MFRKIDILAEYILLTVKIPDIQFFVTRTPGMTNHLHICFFVDMEGVEFIVAHKL